MDNARLQELIDRDEIRQKIYRYCRGIDRRQYDLVRSVYHPDATDDHGDYCGNVDGFIAYVTTAMEIWDSTNHFVGNVLIELDGDRARVETYAIAFHHMTPTETKPRRELIARIRYCDDWERRDGEWKIAARISVIDATRRDEVTDWALSDVYTYGKLRGDDVIFADHISGAGNGIPLSRESMDPR